MVHMLARCFVQAGEAGEHWMHPADEMANPFSGITANAKANG
jgi:hypothetical protein